MTESGDLAVAAALSAVGKPYVFGAAAGDAPAIFDCSSLVQWAWRLAGAELPRASIDQFQALQPAGMGDLRPGDLVFYDYHLRGRARYRGTNHVVMYVGRGQIVEASSTARTVRVIALAAKGRPVGVGRPVPGPAPTRVWRYEIPRHFGLTRTANGIDGWGVERSGRVIPMGHAPSLGNLPNLRRRRRAAGISATPSGRGYWLVDATGQVCAFGDAGFLGQLGPGGARAPVVALAATPSGRGYWLVDATGQVCAFGDAGFFGDRRGIGKTEPVVAIAASSSTRGYWLADAGGQVSSFGGGQRPDGGEPRR